MHRCVIVNVVTLRAQHGHSILLREHRIRHHVLTTAIVMNLVGDLGTILHRRLVTQLEWWYSHVVLRLVLLRGLVNFIAFPNLISLSRFGSRSLFLKDKFCLDIFGLSEALMSMTLFIASWT
jgi:hypothetical protein